jgi:O-antigen/teichoic acid export membrane protein
MIKKLVSTFGIKVIIALLNLVIVIILSRFIGAEGKGQASIIVTSIAMILLFCNMIGGSALVYLVPRYNPFLLFILSNSWSVIVCIIAFIAFNVFPLISASIITPVILLSLINSFLATNLTILLGKEKVMSTNYVSLLQTVINLVVLWLMIKQFNHVNIDAYIWSLYAAMGLCLVVSTILILPYLKKTSLENSKESVFELVKLGLTNQAGHIMKFMSFRISYYAMAYFSGNIVLGVFSNGVALIESLLLISNSFSAILYPKVSNTNDTQYTQQLTLQMTKASIIICVAALIPLLLLPSAFWIWLFGNEFNGVHKVIVLLSPGIILYNIALIIGHYFSGIGKYRINTLSSLLGLLTTVILSLLVLPFYGIKEAGIISSISYFVTALFVMISFTKEANIKIHQLFPGWPDVKWLMKQSKTLLK